MPNPLIDRILASPFFKRAQQEAQQFATDKTKLTRVLEQVLGKSKEFMTKDGRGAAFLDNIQTFVRLLKAYRAGTYREMPIKSIVMILAALLYFLTPIDLVPDFLPLIGIADDITLVFWVVSSLKSDLDRFREWEKQHAHPLPTVS